MIEVAKQLTDYLEQEIKINEECCKRWNAEMKAARDLALLYDRLTVLARLNDPLTITLGDLFLIAQSQLFGAISLLLRRRRSDAELLTRRAIEAAAMTNRLFRHPELLEVFACAHEGIQSKKDPAHWQPSGEFKKLFSTRLLFSEPEEFWKTLRIDYDMMSVMATHAGLGATATVVTVEDRRVLAFFETNDKDLDRAWYHQLAIYWALLRVFFASLKGTGDASMADVLAADIRKWRDAANLLLQRRVPWMADRSHGNTQPGPADILVVPF
jgi:hypothetical protein